MSEIKDAVNHPSHYTFSKFEVFDVLQEWFRSNPLLWQVTKYLARAEHKNDYLEDLEKAKWYLEKEIEHEKKKRGIYLQANPNCDICGVGFLHISEIDWPFVPQYPFKTVCKDIRSCQLRHLKELAEKKNYEEECRRVENDNSNSSLQ